MTKAPLPIVYFKNQPSKVDSPLFNKTDIRYRMALNYITPSNYNGSNPAVTALVGDRLYNKTGCCQSISQPNFPILAPNDKVQDIKYFIPDYLPLTMEQKLEYLKYLDMFFPNTLSWRVIEEKDVAKEVTQIKRWGVGTTGWGVDGTFMRKPTDLIEVTAKCSTSYDYLFFAQFMRLLYMDAQFTLFMGRSEYGGIYHNYGFNIPHLFFHLLELFPKANVKGLFWLSFVLQGMTLNQTFYPYFSFMYKPKNVLGKEVKKGYSAITHYLAGVRNNHFKLPNKLAGATDKDTIVRKLLSSSIGELRDITPRIYNGQDPAYYSPNINVAVTETIAKLFIKYFETYDIANLKKILAIIGFSTNTPNLIKLSLK
jgi:hypothetical protein